IFYTLAFGAALTFVACQSSGGQSNGQQQINTSLSADEFEKKLSDSVQLVDVRTPDEYDGGHIKGALNYNINSGDFEQQLATLNKNKTVLVYCLSGGRSSSAADVMAGMGFKEVYNLSGGIMKWNAAGKSIDTGVEAPLSDGINAADFEKLIKTDKYVLVDYNAVWCKPCIKMKPMLEAFVEKRKDKMQLVAVDADANTQLLKQKGIESVPVLELYKDGKLIWTHNGAIEEAELIKETNL
ncbi:MAG: thioredoxin, partial [Bacteroidia bacterium]|nr:thioredoxin [Bacteroidia bacterium]